MQSGVLQSIRCAAHHLHNFKLKDLKNNKRDLKPEKRKKKNQIRAALKSWLRKFRNKNV